MDKFPGDSIAHHAPSMFQEGTSALSDFAAHLWSGASREGGAVANWVKDTAAAAGPIFAGAADEILNHPSVVIENFTQSAQTGLPPRGDEKI